MTSVTCPRCFAEIPLDPSPRFCPRCGLEDVVKAATDTAPLDVTGPAGTYRVLTRLAVGSISSIYRCQTEKAPDRIGIFKIARDHRGNHAIENEAASLRELCRPAQSPFLPVLVDSFSNAGTPGEPPRFANVLAYDPQIKSPDELYTLNEVAAAYPNGLDAKDVAWIWRRILNVLGLCHASGYAHGAVLPEHVLIEPKDHKLVLIDWCFARPRSRWDQPAENVAIASMKKWYQWNYQPRPASPALDIALAAHCMVYLLNGGGEAIQIPDTLDPALHRHFERCMNLPQQHAPHAHQLLDQFDRLIEALWGSRHFRPLTLPSR
jgi:hypothetical protein